MSLTHNPLWYTVRSDQPLVNIWYVLKFMKCVPYVIAIVCVLCICMCIDHCDTVWPLVGACDAVLWGYTQYYV